MSYLSKAKVRFDVHTIAVAVEWVNHFLKKLDNESLVKAWFKRAGTISNGEIPQNLPYKEGYNNTYNIFLNKITNDEDRRMFSYLCRVFIYRYSLHKGYVQNKTFDLGAYITNNPHQLYELGVLKLGREDMPVNTSLVVQAADMLGVQVTDMVVADILELETRITAVSIESTKSFITQQWEEPNMNQITSLANVAKTEATLIHGRLLSELTESDLIQMIRKARKSQEDIKDLVDASSRMKARYEQLEADIKVYAEALDSLPNGDQPF